MAPKKSRKTKSTKQLVDFDSERFAHQDVERYFFKIQGKILIQEKGFDPSITLSNELWEFVQYHG